MANYSENVLIKNLLNGRTVVQCNLAQSSTKDLQTCTTRYELVNNEELYEFLDRAYEGFNCVSSIDELSELIDRTPYEVLIELLNSGCIELWETVQFDSCGIGWYYTINTATWETASGWI